MLQLGEFRGVLVLAGCHLAVHIPLLQNQQLLLVGFILLLRCTVEVVVALLLQGFVIGGLDDHLLIADKVGMREFLLVIVHLYLQHLLRERFIVRDTLGIVYTRQGFRLLFPVVLRLELVLALRAGSVGCGRERHTLFHRHRFTLHLLHTLRVFPHFLVDGGDNTIHLLQGGGGLLYLLVGGEILVPCYICLEGGSGYFLVTRAVVLVACGFLLLAIVGVLTIAVSSLLIQLHFQFCTLAIGFLQLRLVGFQRNLFVEGNKVVLDGFLVVLYQPSLGGEFGMVTGDDTPQLFQGLATLHQRAFLIAHRRGELVYLPFLGGILLDDVRLDGL